MLSEHGRRLRLANGCCRKLYRRRYEAELCSGRMSHIHAHLAVLDSGVLEYPIQRVDWSARGKPPVKLSITHI